MSAERPPLSIVIPTRNRPERLRACLDTLRPQLGPHDEVVVVDSASSSPSTQQVATEAGARVVVAPRPGASYARNLGWQAASQPHVAFIDDDVTVLDGWAEAMASALAVPGRAFVTGWIGVAPHQAHVPNPQPLLVRPEPRTLDRSTRGAMGTTANCGFPRATLERHGGFSERFGPGSWLSAGEDQELFDRVVADGSSGYYDPGARVYHDQWRSRRESILLQWSYGKGMGGRLAQLVRLDRQRAASTAYDTLVLDGVVMVVKSLRSGFQTGALSALLRVLGTLAGFVFAVARR